VSQTGYIQGTCAFCGGTFRAAETWKGIGEAPGVAHSMPTCAEFDTLGPDEYLREIRRKLAPETFS
jgi:hypothetical protein